MRALSKTLPCLLLWGLGQNAYAALSCADIMELLKYNTPPDTIIKMMKSQGGITAADAACLKKKKAPASIISQADQLAGSSKAAKTKTPLNDEADEQDFGSNKKSGLQDLPEQGGVATGSQPAEIRDARNLLKAKKPLTASFKLFKLLEENKYPNYKTDINYYLGKSLENLKMYHSAQHYYMEVIKQGTDTQYFGSALPNLVKIARYTGDDYDLIRIVKKLHNNPELFPRRAKNHLHYLLGSLHHQKNNLKEAQQNFGRVRDKQLLGLKARYYEGVINNERQKLKSAVVTFKEVYKDANRIDARLDPREAVQVTNIKDLSLLNIGSIYYGIENYKKASEYFQLVDRESDYWPESLFRDAWSNFLVNEVDVTLGKILTVESPYFRNEQFIPEASVLKALTYLSLCDYEQVEQIVQKFEKQYTPMRNEIQEYLTFYNGEGKALSDKAWLTYFGKKNEGSTKLPKALFHRLLRNKKLAGISRHLDVIKEEQNKIKAQKPTWKNSVGVALNKILTKNTRTYQKRAGRVLKKELDAQGNHLRELLNQTNFIKIDLKEAQRDAYIRKASDVDSLKLKQKFNVDFATSPNLIYWPFNGEFWRDELGFYNIIESSSCKR